MEVSAAKQATGGMPQPRDKQRLTLREHVQQQRDEAEVRVQTAENTLAEAAGSERALRAQMSSMQRQIKASRENVGKCRRELRLGPVHPGAGALEEELCQMTSECDQKQQVIATLTRELQKGESVAKEKQGVNEGEKRGTAGKEAAWFIAPSRANVIFLREHSTSAVA
jgi:chromosome segregation ATPase